MPRRVHVAFAVFVNLGELAGTVVGVDLGAVEIFFRGGDAEGFGEGVQAHVFAAPFATFLHRVEDRIVAKTGEREVARRLPPSYVLCALPAFAEAKGIDRDIRLAVKIFLFTLRADFTLYVGNYDQAGLQFCPERFPHAFDAAATTVRTVSKC